MDPPALAAGRCGRAGHIDGLLAMKEGAAQGCWLEEHLGSPNVFERSE
jgi:hypothetical protein